MGGLILSLISYLSLISLLMSFIIVAKEERCSDSICGRRNGYLSIRFPFRITNIDQPEYCGYPGFELYCDFTNNQTLIHIPNTGDFSVEGIDYIKQEILVSDLDNCLARKLLSGLNLSLSHSPFRFKEYQYSYDFSFYNCTENNGNYTSRYSTWYKDKIGCLSTVPNYVVIGVRTSLVQFVGAWCDNWVGNASYTSNLISDLSSLGSNMLLSWDEPKCGLCEGNITRCRFKENARTTTLETICLDYDPPIVNEIAGQLSKRQRIAVGVSVGVGGLVIVILILVLCKICIRSRRRSSENSSDTSVEMTS